MKKGDWYFIDGEVVILITNDSDNDDIVSFIDFRKSFIYPNVNKVDFIKENFTKAHSVDIKNNRYSFFNENNHYIGEVEI